jgi:3-oxoacyl-[acyl-carrier-protein] synthase-3
VSAPDRLRRSIVIGCGGYLPARIVANAELESTMDTSDTWISERTGILQRHIAADGEKTSDLAIAASRSALAHAGIEAGEVDLIVLATTTPDETFPATAVRVQAALGCPGSIAFDVQAVCSGFVYALAIADNFLRVGQARTALVIGAETFSRILDWNDRGTAVLFGDGAGAVVLKAVDRTEGEATPPGIQSTQMHADGRHHDALFADGGPSSTPGRVGVVRMNGREVFRHAVEKLSGVVEEALAANGFSPSDIDWLVPHQANRRIIDGMARKLGLPSERVVVTVDRHANTSAASIPLALWEATKSERIAQGDIVLLEAIGGGLTWGACVIRW